MAGPRPTAGGGRAIPDGVDFVSPPLRSKAASFASRVDWGENSEDADAYSSSRSACPASSTEWHARQSLSVRYTRLLLATVFPRTLRCLGAAAGRFLLRVGAFAARAPRLSPHALELGRGGRRRAPHSPNAATACRAWCPRRAPAAPAGAYTRRHAAHRALRHDAAVFVAASGAHASSVADIVHRDGGQHNAQGPRGVRHDGPCARRRTSPGRVRSEERRCGAGGPAEYSSPRYRTGPQTLAGKALTASRQDDDKRRRGQLKGRCRAKSSRSPCGASDLVTGLALAGLAVAGFVVGRIVVLDRQGPQPRSVTAQAEGKVTLAVAPHQPYRVSAQARRWIVWCHGQTAPGPAGRA